MNGDTASLEIPRRRFRTLFSQTVQNVLALIGKDRVTSAPLAEMNPRLGTEATMRTKLKDLELPPQENERMLAKCEQLGFHSPEDLRQIEESTKLRHFFGGQYVATLRTSEGIEVVGASAPGVRLAARIANSSELTEEEKLQVSINLVPRGLMNGNERTSVEFPTQFVGIER